MGKQGSEMGDTCCGLCGSLRVGMRLERDDLDALGWREDYAAAVWCEECADWVPAGEMIATTVLNEH